MAIGGEVRRVVFEFVGDSSDLAKAGNEASGSLDDVASSGTKATGVMSKMKPAAIAAGAAAGAMALKWAAGGIEMAQTAEQISLSFGKTFGDAGDEMLAQNEEMRKSLGMSEQEFQKMSIEIGAVSRALHQSEEEAAAFTQEMITVAGDVAAFNGELDAAPEVMDAMNSALIGSFDSLEKYGVEVTAAMVAQRAMADTGKTAESELTGLEKRTATMALITEQAALQQGALNDAQEMGATQTNEIKAEMEDLQTTVGAALLPIKMLFLQVLAAAVPILTALTPLLQLLGELLEALMPILTPLIKALEFFAAIIEIIVKAIMQLIHWLGQAGNKLIGFRNQINQTLDRLNPLSNFSLPSFHAGGTVPGASGTERLAVVQAGEEIMTRGQARTGGGGGGGMTNHITVNVSPGGDPNETARAIKEMLQNLEDRGG